MFLVVKQNTVQLVVSEEIAGKQLFCCIRGITEMRAEMCKIRLFNVSIGVPATLWL